MNAMIRNLQKKLSAFSTLAPPKTQGSPKITGPRGLSQIKTIYVLCGGVLSAPVPCICVLCSQTLNQFLTQVNKKYMMNAPLHRIIFYTADLKQITGKGERSCQRMMQLMRDFFGLRKHQPITVYHASEFLGLSLEQLMPYMRY